MSELLLAQALTKKFQSKTALHELNLSVRRSEVVCLLRANGAKYFWLFISCRWGSQCFE